jgi:hypothetical protein
VREFSSVGVSKKACALLLKNNVKANGLCWVGDATGIFLFWGGCFVPRYGAQQQAQLALPRCVVVLLLRPLPARVCVEGARASVIERGARSHRSESFYGGCVPLPRFEKRAQSLFFKS